MSSYNNVIDKYTANFDYCMSEINKNIVQEMKQIRFEEILKISKEMLEKDFTFTLINERDKSQARFIAVKDCDAVKQFFPEFYCKTG